MVIANFAVKLIHKIDVPKSVLQLIISSGSNVNKYPIADERIAEVTLPDLVRPQRLFTLRARWQEFQHYPIH